MRKMKWFLSLLWVLVASSAVLQAQGNNHASDQKAGSVLVFPFYTSNSANRATHDTRITLNNIGVGAGQSVIVHLLAIGSRNCEQTDKWIFLTPNASYSDLMSNLDSDTQGYLIAIAVGESGCLIQKNVLTGNAFVKAPAGALGTGSGAICESYNAQAFWAYQAPLCDPTGTVATLAFDGATYDMVPNAFAVDIQNPARVSGQVITVASLSGSVVPPGELDHARNVGTGLIYKCGSNGMPEARSFTNSFLTGNCLTNGVITVRVPINAPNPLSSFYPLMDDVPYTLYFSVRAGLGLIFTSKNDPMLNNNPGGWAGIRYLHATSYTAAALEVPLLTPPF